MLLMGEMMRQPNRTRKYKPLYYVLMLSGIILMCTISVTLESDKIMDTRIKSKIDSGDYHKKTLFVTDKSEKQDMSGYVYYFFTGFSGGNTSTEYILYSDDIEIVADATTYESVKIGDKVEVFVSEKGTYYTNLRRTVIEDIDTHGLDFIFFLSPCIGLLIFFLTLVNRKNFINPYYGER